MDSRIRDVLQHPWKLVMLAGIFIGILGMSDTTSRGYDTWLAPYLRTGPELLFYHATQWVLILAGLSMVVYAVAVMQD